MNILIVNDDGFGDGVIELANTIKTSENFAPANIHCVVPDQDRSCSGAGLTVSRTIRATEHRSAIVDKLYKVDGLPLDCVHFGLAKFDADFVLSGINIGPNLGTDWLYSGTVCAAIEARRLGRNSIAFSYCGDLDSFNRYRAEISKVITDVLRDILIISESHQTHRFSYSVNIPDFDEDREYKGHIFVNDLEIKHRIPSIQVFSTSDNEIEFTLNNVVAVPKVIHKGDSYYNLQHYTTVSGIGI